MRFNDRAKASRLLTGRLDHLRGMDVVVLVVPRGGVPVGVEVANALGAALDISVVRKLGQPFQPEVAVGCFGTGHGAAAAIRSAADPSSDLFAVVSLSGRLDLAEPWLGRVRPPTLLVVGSADEQGVALHRRLGPRLRCEHRLPVVHGSAGRFDEPDALDTVARPAREWFTGHLASSARPSA